MKFKKSIWRGRVIQITFSDKKEYSEHLKTKWRDKQKKYKVLINNVSLDYSKKIVSVPTRKYMNASYMEETVHDLTAKTIQRKKL